MEAKVYSKSDFENEEELFERLNWHSKMHVILAKQLAGLMVNFSFEENNIIPYDLWTAVSEKSKLNDNQIQ